jgi:hypothetical protein
MRSAARLNGRGRRRPRSRHGLVWPLRFWSDARHDLTRESAVLPRRGSRPEDPGGPPRHPPRQGLRDESPPRGDLRPRPARAGGLPTAPRDSTIFVGYGALAAASGLVGITFNHRLHSDMHYPHAADDVAVVVERARHPCSLRRRTGQETGHASTPSRRYRPTRRYPSSSFGWEASTSSSPAPRTLLSLPPRTPTPLEVFDIAHASHSFEIHAYDAPSCPAG